MTALPRLALSVRQPWAHAIIHLGKDCENRKRFAIDNGGMRTVVGQRIAIHASKGMTREEYEQAADTMAKIGVTCPPAAELERGGIIGAVEVVDIVKDRDRFPSRWYFGPYALLLRRPEPHPFVGATGQIGIFAWTRNGLAQDPPARWMGAKSPERVLEPDLFGGR